MSTNSSFFHKQNTRIWVIGIAMLMLVLFTILLPFPSPESLPISLARFGCALGLGVAFGWIAKEKIGQRRQLGNKEPMKPELGTAWDTVVAMEARTLALEESYKEIRIRTNNLTLQLSRIYRMLPLPVGAATVEEVQPPANETAPSVSKQANLPGNVMQNASEAVREHRKSELKPQFPHPLSGNRQLNFEEIVVRQWRAFWTFEGGNHKGDIAKLRAFFEGIGIPPRYTIEPASGNADLARIRQEGSNEVLLVPLHHFFANIREFFDDEDDRKLPVATISDLVSPAVADQNGLMLRKGRVRIQ